MIPKCAATRHVHFELDGSGPAVLPTPTLEDWPKVTWEANTKTSTRVNLDTLTKEEVASWKPGRSEEHTSELQSLMRISYAVFCLKKKNKQKESTLTNNPQQHRTSHT